MESTLRSGAPPLAAPKLHLAVIMDGNGRWAERRGLRRAAGHRAGVEAVRRIVAAAPARGVGVLTLFAFSTENWGRPRSEIAALMLLLRGFLRKERDRLITEGARLEVIGRRDRLDRDIIAAIEELEAATRGGRRLTLRLALDYSARDALLEAIARAPRPAALTRDGLSRLLAQNAAARAVDLMIRTSGERRLSDFLLWESAFAELYFTERLWPDFTEADLDAALADFARRERRFGALPSNAAEA